MSRFQNLAAGAAKKRFWEHFSESDLESKDENTKINRISSRQKRPPVVFEAKPENPIAERKANLLKHYTSNKTY